MRCWSQCRRNPFCAGSVRRCGCAGEDHQRGHRCQRGHRMADDGGRMGCVAEERRIQVGFGSRALGRPEMRIFQIVETLELGGSETQAVEVATRLALEGHELCFGCMRPGPLRERLDHEGVPLVEFPLTGVFRPSGIMQMFRLCRLLKSKRFDIVHSHDLYSDLFAVPAAWLAGTPTIVSSRRDLGHWWWYTPRNRRILRFIQERSTWVIANSHAV